MLKMKKTTYIIVFSLLFNSCSDDFLELSPTDSISELNAINDVESAESALAGLYNSFAPLINGGTASALLRYGNLADEQAFIAPTNPFNINAVDVDNSDLAFGWNSSWNTIRDADNILNLLPQADDVPIEIKSRILSEVKCIRALNYALLIQFWGDLPYSEETDFRIRRELSRTSTVEIYSEIISDVEEAVELLPGEFESSDLTRTRFTKGAAQALLSRLLLYNGNWAAAESTANELINNPLYELQLNYEDVFTKNSTESILELASNASPSIHQFPVAFVYPASLGGFYLYFPTEKIINSFEPNDNRFAISIGEDTNGIRYINKYQDIAGNGNFNEFKIFRLAEQYLIRAEARAKQGDIVGALADLNIIRNRAGIPDATGSTEQDLLLLIEQERYLEFCFEGHRWIDLVRTGRVDEVIGTFNPAWNTRARLLPIPQTEIDNNSNIVQNPGY